MHISPFSFLVAIICVGALGGCTTSTDPGDREFFNRGWVNPHELDTDDNFRPREQQMKDKQPSPTQLDHPLAI